MRSTHRIWAGWIIGFVAVAIAIFTIYQRELKSRHEQRTAAASVHKLIRNLWSANEIWVAVRYTPSERLEHVWPMLAPQMIPHTGYLAIHSDSITVMDSDHREVVTLSRDGSRASLAGNPIDVHAPAVDWARSLLLPGLHPFLPTILDDSMTRMECSKREDIEVLTLFAPDNLEEWTARADRVVSVRYISGRSDSGEAIYATVSVLTVK